MCNTRTEFLSRKACATACGIHQAIIFVHAILSRCQSHLLFYSGPCTCMRQKEAGLYISSNGVWNCFRRWQAHCQGGLWPNCCRLLWCLMHGSPANAATPKQGAKASQRHAMQPVVLIRGQRPHHACTHGAHRHEFCIPTPLRKPTLPPPCASTASVKATQGHHAWTRRCLHVDMVPTAMLLNIFATCWACM